MFQRFHFYIFTHKMYITMIIKCQSDFFHSNKLSINGNNKIVDGWFNFFIEKTLNLFLDPFKSHCNHNIYFKWFGLNGEQIKTHLVIHGIPMEYLIYVINVFPKFMSSSRIVELFCSKKLSLKYVEHKILWEQYGR